MPGSASPYIISARIILCIGTAVYYNTIDCNIIIIISRIINSTVVRADNVILLCYHTIPTLLRVYVYNMMAHVPRGSRDVCTFL